MIIALKNSFHNTMVRVQVPASVEDGWGWIQEQVYAHSPQPSNSSARRRLARVRKPCAELKAACAEPFDDYHDFNENGAIGLVQNIQRISGRDER